MAIESTPTLKVIFWRPLAWLGMEQMFIEYYDDEEDAGYAVDGMVLAVLDGVPSRTWYHLGLDPDWRFERLWFQHTSEMPWPECESASCELWLDSDGSWRHRGLEQAPDLTGCIDIDITVTPFTNTLPIRRLQLEQGQSAEINVAWIHVPEIRVERARQRYSRLAAENGLDRYRFEGLDSGFTADITVDDDGLVTDYPGLFRRIWPEAAPTSGSA